MLARRVQPCIQAVRQDHQMHSPSPSPSPTPPPNTEDAVDTRAVKAIDALAPLRDISNRLKANGRKTKAKKTTSSLGGLDHPQLRSKKHSGACEPVTVPPTAPETKRQTPWVLMLLLPSYCAKCAYFGFFSSFPFSTPAVQSTSGPHRRRCSLQRLRKTVK